MYLKRALESVGAVKDLTLLYKNYFTDWRLICLSCIILLFILWVYQFSPSSTITVLTPQKCPFLERSKWKFWKYAPIAVVFRNYWVFRIFPSSVILKQLIASETELVLETLRSSEDHTMDEVQKRSNHTCCTPSQNHLESTCHRHVC
jgi:hypothetical protein